MSSLGDWLDERVGHRAFLARLVGGDVPGGARWSRVFGGAIGVLFVVQVVTGLALMTAYVPGVASAWASVHFITHRLAGGWVLRGMHHYASQALLVLAGAHLVQTAIFGAYRRPREVNWLLGLALVGVVFGLAQTGSFLPLDQKGYWATKVDLNIAGSAPGIGPWIQRLVLGGSDLGSLALTRFYAMHVALLPLLALAIMGVHVALARKHGLTAPPDASASASEPYFPRQAAMNLAAAMLVLAVVLAVALRLHGAPLAAPADPTSDYPARPEWYVLPLYELRKLVHGPLETPVVLATPAVVGGYLALLPWIDRARTTELRQRVLALAPLLAGFAALPLLVWLAVSADAADTKYEKARVAAALAARTASRIARDGVPPEGPLYMLAHDPELRGRALFSKSCAPCHVLGDLGDPKKATAATLDRWGTEAWVASMLDDPDAADRFGKTPYKGMMPSMLHAPADRKPDDPPFKPMSDADVKAVSVFLASRSDPKEGAPQRRPEDLKAGESIVTVRCTTCHFWNGDGDDSGQGYAPELSTWGTAAWVSAQITDPATKATYRENALDAKMKGHMPRLGGDLAADDVQLLGRWVQAHARGRTLE